MGWGGDGEGGGAMVGGARAGEAGDGELAACVAAGGAVAEFEGEGEGEVGGKGDAGCDGLAGAGEGEGCGGHCWNYVSCVFFFFFLFSFFLCMAKGVVLRVRGIGNVYGGMVGKGLGFWGARRGRERREDLRVLQIKKKIQGGIRRD